jgi:translation initiation factor IF-3
MRGKSVRLISQDNEQLGVVPIEEAMAKAREVGLDLVAVAENSDPVVCRFMDYGRHRYEEKRKMKEQRKKQSTQKNKEVKFHVNTDTHDFNLKVSRVLEFLSKGYKVRVSLFFRGREMAHRERGIERMEEVIKAVGDLGIVDAPPKMSGRIVGAQLSPTAAKAKPKTRAKSDQEDGTEPDQEAQD